MKKQILSLIVTTMVLATSPAFGMHKEGIFSYDDPDTATNLHVTLHGTTSKGLAWTAREVQIEDLPFYQTIFSNSDVMAKFGRGQQEPNETKEVVENIWLPRLKAGQPTAPLTILIDNRPVGIMTIAASREPNHPGVALFGGLGEPEVWRQGLASKLLETMLMRWAPEVKRMGYGWNLDPSKHENIIRAFQCFQGGPLERIEATASPSNVASWKSLEKMGFEPALWNVSNLTTIVDYQGQGLSFKAIEQNLLNLFSSQEVSPLSSDVRYRMIDAEGKVRTFGKDKNYDSIKFYFEYDVKSQSKL